MTDAALADDTGNTSAAENLLDGNDSTVDTTPKGDAQSVPDGDLLSDDGASSQEGVPESYTFEPPEGSNVEITEEIQAALTQFGEAARKMGLSQAQYQALVEYDLNRAVEAEQAAVGAWTERVNAWKSSAIADKEIGGDNLPQTKANAQAALKKFGADDFAQLLKNPTEQNPDGLALGNHPAVLRFLAKVGKAFGDPEPIDGKETAGTDEQARLKRMYPSMFGDN